jgi:hypothetical protein
MQSHQDSIMYVPRMDAFVNRWFTGYEEARRSRDAEGGFLFPYGRHFFVTDAGAIEELGLDPRDPDWERIRWDWVRPRDPAAWERLSEKRAMATAGR